MPGTLWELIDALGRIDADETVRAVLYTASGDSNVFCSGFSPEASQYVLAEDPTRQPPQLLAGLRVPTVAALFGLVSGAALELALACDLRIASDDALLGLTELAQGRLPCWGATQRLSRIVGIGRALELVLLANTVSAAEALSYGLVTRVVRRADLNSEARQIASSFVQGPGVALAYVKEAVREGGDLTLDHALRLEWDLAVLLETTGDRAEGIESFLAKRSPRFTGE